MRFFYCLKGFNTKLSKGISSVQISNPIFIFRFLIILIQQFKQSLKSHPQEGASSIWREKSLLLWDDFPEMLVTRWIKRDTMEVRYAYGSVFILKHGRTQYVVAPYLAIFIFHQFGFHQRSFGNIWNKEAA